MAQPLMPKATAVWLVDNTTLTFEQIADFCGMHVLEVQAIADGEVASGLVGLDPIANGQIDREDLERCQADPNARLKMRKPRDVPKPKGRKARYTPVSKRGDKPDAIAWLLRNHPELTDGQIGKLIGTTKNTINAVRDRTHWNSSNIKARDPVLLGLCSQRDLNAAIARAKAEGRVPPQPEEEPKPAAESQPEAGAEPPAGADSAAAPPSPSENEGLESA